jgi:hypothetical protein
MLEQLINLHNAESHNYDLDADLDFTISRINDKELTILNQNAHNRYFWSAFNKSRKLLISHFFGLPTGIKSHETEGEPIPLVSNLSEW